MPARGADITSAETQSADFQLERSGALATPPPTSLLAPQSLISRKRPRTRFLRPRQWASCEATVTPGGEGEEKRENGNKKRQREGDGEKDITERRADTMLVSVCGN